MNTTYRNRRHSVAWILVVLFIIVSALTLPPQSTDAEWNQGHHASGTFQAANIGPLRNFQCDASNTLLTTRVDLRWDTPAELVGEDVTYEVSWEGSGLLSGSGGPIEVRGNQYTYRQTLLTGVLDFGVDFTVVPKLANTRWAGESSYASANGFTLLGAVGGFDCEIVGPN
ncbi:hypothetical protein [Enteractinococcus helveticum]|uniref:Uncharacterized protein n=1 Tax=Enteractinococcus helveticum TaxID=1837282 RepID=A0A1B7LV90_9MICC|nr:hypothetical protein [Enteractinococcus helveticum]OAV52150.1 hypothetical protein A6F49_01120 [Enteractinococcus helveticum]